MSNDKDNIIHFKIQNPKTKLFKNASLVDLESGEVELVDILVDGETISQIMPAGKIKENKTFQVEDLEENYVLSPFSNLYCNSVEAVRQTFGLEIDGQVNVTETDVNSEKIFKVYGGEGATGNEFMPLNCFVMMKMKNYIAGAAFVNDFSATTTRNFEALEHIEKLSDQELDEICERFHKNKTLPFLRAGQTLEELGTVDKLHNKPLSHVLEDFGLLDLGPVIVGGNCFEKDELELLKQYDCKFVVTPFEDGKLGRRPTNLIRLKNMGFVIGMGSGNAFEIDFFEYMRHMLMQMRSMFESEGCFSEIDALDIALLTSRKLMEGDKAHFMVIKKDISLYDDIFHELVWEKSNSDVLMTVEYGEIMQKNGKIVMQDAPTYDKLKQMTKIFTRRNKNDN